MSGAPKIAILDGGTYYHHFTIYDSRYRHHFTEIAYAPELFTTSLEPFDAVIVPDRLHPRLLSDHAEKLIAFANLGRTLVVFGENQAHSWLPGAKWCHRPTNFWWWLEEGADSGLRLADPEHALFQHLSLEDATWHYHGLFQPPAGAERLIVLEGEGEADTILYEDTVSTAGRLIVTCLDPVYHHGSNFMPATTRFLDGFLSWLAADLASGLST